MKFFQIKRFLAPEIKATRRAFLTASACALAAGLVTTTLGPPPAKAWPVRGLFVSDLTFKGNPNSIVTAISGSIVCPRLTAQTDAFFQVSASGITASGTRVDFPYEALEYRWNFGDPGGAEFFVRPTDGVSVNANSGQISPEGFYCYRTPGTKIITLTAIGKAATGFIVQTFQLSVIVTAHPNSDIAYFDANAPGGGDGLTAATAFNSIANLSSAAFWNAHKTNLVVMLARGSLWSATTGFRMPNGASLTGAITGARFKAYQGPYSVNTAKPHIDTANSSDSNLGIPCNLGSGSAVQPTWVKADFVFSNIRFTVSGTTTYSTVLNVTPGAGSVSAYRDLFFDNCEFESLVNTAGDVVLLSSAAPGGSLDRVGFWGGIVASPTVTCLGRRNLMGGNTGVENWYFILGIAMSGAGIDPQADHYIYPETQTHGYYKWVDIGATGTGNGRFNFFLNLNWNGTTLQNGGFAGGFAYAEFICISECGTTASPSPSRICDGAQSNNSTATFTGGGSADITIAGSVTLAPVGARLAFGTSGTLPSEISAYLPYWVVSSPGTGTNGIVQISLTQGGPAITFASAGSGNFVLQTMFRNLVIERCGFGNMGQDGLLLGQQIEQVTFRDQRVWNFTAGNITTPGPRQRCKLYAYRNRIDSPSGLAAFAQYTDTNMTNSWLEPVQFTDNVIVDRRAAAVLEQLSYTNMAANGSIVDRNKFYTDGTSAFIDNVTSKNLAQQQAAGFDVNSTIQAIAAAPWPSAPTSWNGFGS
jgi:hypothetical protein